MPLSACIVVRGSVKSQSEVMVVFTAVKVDGCLGGTVVVSSGMIDRM